MSDYGSSDDVKRKIRDNVLKTEPKDATKNPLWQNFVAIYEEVDDNKKVNVPFVACVKCSSVLSYDSGKGGTSHWRRHADVCSKSSPTSPSVSNYFKPASLPKAAKELISLHSYSELSLLYSSYYAMLHVSTFTEASCVMRLTLYEFVLAILSYMVSKLVRF